MKKNNHFRPSMQEHARVLQVDDAKTLSFEADVRRNLNPEAVLGSLYWQEDEKQNNMQTQPTTYGDPAKVEQTPPPRPSKRDTHSAYESALTATTKEPTTNNAEKCKKKKKKKKGKNFPKKK